MGAMTLYALGITELRDIFGAAPALAERLRALTSQHFPPPEPTQQRRGTLIGRLGPVLKQPIDPPPIPQRPGLWDAEALLGARAIAPERLGYAWQLTTAWLAELSWGHISLPGLDEAELARIEFDLARAGLPSQLGLGRLLRNDPSIPLRPLPGQRVGYAKSGQVEAAREGLTMVIGDLAEASVPTVGAVLDFLNDYPDWTQQAAADARPAPDLIVVWQDAAG